MDESTDKIALLINDEVRRLGITIIDNVFEGVRIPEEARRFASGMGQQAMAMQYAKETAEVLPPGGGAAAAGIGAGLGLSLGSQMARATQPEAGTKQVLVCPHCGAQNPVGNKFCGNCGESITPPKKVNCPNCGAEMPETMKFCGNCGKPMKSEKPCPKCGAQNPTNMKFCGECGEKLS